MGEGKWPHQPSAQCYLRLVGAVEVSWTISTWEAHSVGSRKALTLLAVLGARARQTVTLEEVVDALWEGSPPQQPAANVATLVSRLRGRFGPEIIVGGRAGYRLGDGVHVDLHEAAALITTAEKALQASQPAYGLLVVEQAIKLLAGGPVLADFPGVDWAEQARVTQRSLLRRSWHVGAETSLRTGAPGLAEALADTAIAADPLDEAAYRLLMRAHVAAGEPDKAVLAYQRLRLALAGRRTGPAEVTRVLHASILRTCAATG
jgi:DNA-binding SARP family transcriptional activator